MAWVTIANVRGPRGYKGDTGNPLNAAGWAYMVENFDALDGGMTRAPIITHGQSDHIAWGVQDFEGRVGWNAVNDWDGGPTEEGEYAIRKAVGIGDHNHPTLGGGFLDSAFNPSELVHDPAGNVPDWVLQRWASRMGAAGSGGGLGVGDRILLDGQLQRVFPDIANVWGFGSSTMQLLATFLTDKFAGAEFHGEGKGGERAQQIFARHGSTPAMLTVTGGQIPASGTVAVTASNMPTNQFLKPFTGTLAGVSGTLSSTDAQMTFTRATAGAAVTVPDGTPFLPSTLEQVRYSVGLLNAGKNNMSDSGDVIGLVTSLTNAAYDWMGTFIKRVVVMTHFVDSNQTPGSTQFNNVQGVNANILARYGDTAFDLNAYILSSQIWADTGITPTPTDLTQQGNGLKPDSLSQDAAHLNTAANTAVAMRVQEHFAKLGFYLGA